MQYKILKITSTCYKLQEIPTQLIYDCTFKDYDSARKLRDHLNKGGGFAGFTPGFFIWK